MLEKCVTHARSDLIGVDVEVRERRAGKQREPAPEQVPLSFAQAASEEAKVSMSPRWIAPVATWLASSQSAGVTGRVFEASGRVLAIAESWHRGPMAEAVDDPTEVDAIARDLLAKARPNADMNGQDREA